MDLGTLMEMAKDITVEQALYAAGSAIAAGLIGLVIRWMRSKAIQKYDSHPVGTVPTPKIKEVIDLIRKAVRR